MPRYLSSRLLFLICFSAPYFGNAQPIIGMPPMKGYSSPVHRFVGDITQDNRGILFFVSRPGIISYDGVRFEKVDPDLQGLTDIDRDSKGTIYALGGGFFLKSYVDSLGQIKFVNLLDRWKDVKILRGSLHPAEKRMYARSRDGIFEYDFELDSLTRYPGSFSYAFVMDDCLWAVRDETGELVVFKNGQLIRAPFTDSLVNNKVPIRTASLSFTDSERLLNLPSGLVAYTGKSDRLRPLKEIGDFRQSLATGRSITSRLHFLGSTLKGGLIIDSLGNQLQHFSMANGLVSNSAIGSFVDRESNLWIGLFGFKKNQLMKTEHGNDLRLWPIPGTPLDLLKFKNKVYFSTTQNLFVIDPVTHEMTPVFQGDHRIEAMANVKINNEEHLLAALTPEGQVVEVDQSGKSKVIYETPSITWLRQSRSNPNRLYLVSGLQTGYLLYTKGKWVYHKLEVDFPCLELEEDADGSLWLTDGSRRRLVHVFPKNDNDIFEVKEAVMYDENDSLPRGFIIPYLLGNNQMLFKSNAGMLQFNATSDKFERWTGLGKKIDSLGTIRSAYKNEHDGSYYLQRAQEDGLGILHVKPMPGGDTIIISKPFTRVLQSAGILGDRAFLGDEKSVWFAGMEEYLVRYTASEDVRTYNSPFNCYIRKVTLNDRLLYGGYFPGNELSQLKPELLYDSGRLTIRFAAPFYDYEDKTLYAYKMEGLDKAWSPWQSVGEKEYQHLNEGEYTFLVKAKNVYGQESEVASFSFSVLPPWYRTWWAYVAYLILAGWGVVGLVRWRTFSLRKKKKALEQLVQVKTQELKEANSQLIEANNDLEMNREELQQTNDELITINEHLQKTQLKLVESEKMASLGQLTAGIAHEINNPINFIFGGVQAMNSVTQELINSKDHSPEKFESAIREIQDLMASINNGVNRTANIISSLKTFTSPSENIDTYIDVRECMESSIVLLKRKLADHNVTIVRKFEHKSRVLANAGQLSQVFINLIDNAIYALKDVKGAREISITTSQQEGELSVRLRDNGTGISPESLSHIFEPFYTTKETGAGVGLGLSISFSIIEKHKGKIACVSKKGEGTEFTVTLPISSAGSEQ